MLLPNGVAPDLQQIIYKTMLAKTQRIYNNDLSNWLIIVTTSLCSRSLLSHTNSLVI